MFPIALDTFFGFPGETIRFVVAAWGGAPIMLAISESNPDFAPIAQAVVESMEFEEQTPAPRVQSAAMTRDRRLT